MYHRNSKGEVREAGPFSVDEIQENVALLVVITTIQGSSLCD